MEHNYESYEDLAKNGQYSEASNEVTENQAALKPVVPLPQLSGFPKPANEWKRTVEQNILGLRKTVTCIATNVGIIAEDISEMKTDIKEIKDLLKLGQQAPAGTSAAYQKPRQVQQTSSQGLQQTQGQNGQANQGQTQMQ